MCEPKAPARRIRSTETTDRRSISEPVNASERAPKLESVAVEKDALLVHILDPDLGETRFLNQMQGIGTYLAVVVPKHTGPIKFLRKKGEPAPR